jgi:hypothetical protein
VGGGGIGGGGEGEGGEAAAGAGITLPFSERPVQKPFLSAARDQTVMKVHIWMCHCATQQRGDKNTVLRVLTMWQRGGVGGEGGVGGGGGDAAAMEGRHPRRPATAWAWRSV